MLLSVLHDLISLSQTPGWPVYMTAEVIFQIPFASLVALSLANSCPVHTKLYSAEAHIQQHWPANGCAACRPHSDTKSVTLSGPNPASLWASCGPPG